MIAWSISRQWTNAANSMSAVAFDVSFLCLSVEAPMEQLV